MSAHNRTPEEKAARHEAGKHSRVGFEPCGVCPARKLEHRDCPHWSWCFEQAAKAGKAAVPCGRCKEMSGS